MTGLIEFETVAEALALIDKGLGDLQNRNLVTTDEMSDLLLDVRMILASAGQAVPSDASQLEEPLATS